MAYENEHPIRQDGRKFHGENLDSDTARYFIRLGPAERRMYLSRLHESTVAPDGQSLRKKSQLMRDHQTLSRIDAELRALSR
jgi:hypothetical protein